MMIIIIMKIILIIIIMLILLVHACALRALCAPHCRTGSRSTARRLLPRSAADCHCLRACGCARRAPAHCVTPAHLTCAALPLRFACRAAAVTAVRIRTRLRCTPRTFTHAARFLLRLRCRHATRRSRTAHHPLLPAPRARRFACRAAVPRTCRARFWFTTRGATRLPHRAHLHAGAHHTPHTHTRTAGTPHTTPPPHTRPLPPGPSSCTHTPACHTQPH